MNKKIVGFFFCFIIIFLVFQPFVSSYVIDNSESFNDDLPIWEVGDYWTYSIDDIAINYQYADEMQEIQFNLNIETDDLNMEVMEDSGDSYRLHFNMKINGEISVLFDRGMGAIEFILNLGRFPSTKIQGEIIYNKNNLGIKESTIELSGILNIKIKQQPFISIPIPSLCIPIKMVLNSIFSTPFALLEFPLYVDNYWFNPTTNLTLQDGYIRSPYLRLINFIHNIARLFRLVPDEYKELSDNIADILPIIDINNLLEILTVGNTIDIQRIMGLECVSYEEIDTLLGSLEVYNISMIGSDFYYGNMYYSATVGRIVKVSINGIIISLFIRNLLRRFIMDPPIIDFPDFNIELIKTNH